MAISYDCLNIITASVITFVIGELIHVTIGPSHRPDRFFECCSTREEAV